MNNFFFTNNNNIEQKQDLDQVSYFIPAIMDPEESRSFHRGKSFRFWKGKDHIGKTFINDEFYQDFVEYDDALYACLTTTSTIPGTTSDWGLVTSGTAGKSAYDLWIDLGNIGTIEDFLITLKGQAGLDGKDGINGKDGRDGKDGKDGANGADGKDGANGKDGVSPIVITLDTDLSTVKTNGFGRVNHSVSNKINVYQGDIEVFGTVEWKILPDQQIISVENEILILPETINLWQSETTQIQCEVTYNDIVYTKIWNVVKINDSFDWAEY